MGSNVESEVIFRLLYTELKKAGHFVWGDVDIARHGGTLFYLTSDKNHIHYIVVRNYRDSLDEYDLLEQLGICGLTEDDLRDVEVVSLNEGSLDRWVLADLLEELERNYSFYLNTPFDTAGYSEKRDALFDLLSNQDQYDNRLQVWDPWLLEQYLNSFISSYKKEVLCCL